MKCMGSKSSYRKLDENRLRNWDLHGLAGPADGWLAKWHHSQKKLTTFSVLTNLWNKKKEPWITFSWLLCTERGVLIMNTKKLVLDENFYPASSHEYQCFSTTVVNSMKKYHFLDANVHELFTTHIETIKRSRNKNSQQSTPVKHISQSDFRLLHVT